MKNNNTLSRIRQTLLPMACSLMEKSPHLQELQEGAILQLKVVNNFKAVFQWFGEHGTGEELFMALTQKEPAPLLNEVYVVTKVRNPFMRFWRKHTIGGKYYLKLVEPGFNENLRIYFSDTLKSFKYREVMF